MALTSHLLSFLAASASSADRHHPRRKLRLDFLDRDAVLVLIKLGQTLPYCRDELQFLCYIIDRSVIRHTAQQRLNDLFVRASHVVRHRTSLSVRFSYFNCGTSEQGRSSSSSVPETNDFNSPFVSINPIHYSIVLYDNLSNRLVFKLRHDSPSFGNCPRLLAC